MIYLDFLFFYKILCFNDRNLRLFIKPYTPNIELDEQDDRVGDLFGITYLFTAYLKNGIYHKT